MLGNRRRWYDKSPMDDVRYLSDNFIGRGKGCSFRSKKRSWWEIPGTRTEDDTGVSRQKKDRQNQSRRQQSSRPYRLW